MSVPTCIGGDERSDLEYVNFSDSEIEIHLHGFGDDYAM